MKSLEIILELGKITLPEQKKIELADKKNSWFVEYIKAVKPEEIFPGVREMLKKLKSQGIKIGLASSSKNADTVISLLEIKDEFDAVVDGTMIVHTKPDPEIFLLAAKNIVHRSSELFGI